MCKKREGVRKRREKEKPESKKNCFRVIFEGKRVYETDEIESENGIQNTKLILNTVIGLLKVVDFRIRVQNIIP